MPERGVVQQATAPPDGQVRRGRPGYDQQTVLRRAIELFNKQGYDATSMGDLGRELGLSKSAIYHHVPSKEGLLQAALDEALDGLSAAVDEASMLDRPGGPDGQSARTRLTEVVRGSVRVLAEHRPAVTLLLRVRGNSPAEVEALRRRREIDNRLAVLVRAAVDEGELRDDLDPAVVSRLLFGMVNSLIEWWRPEGPVSADELADTLTTMLFEGLLRRD